MRQLDVFQSYFNNAGKFLNGRLRFCNPDSSPANVYDKDGISIGSAVQTTSSGRLAKEVFLGSHDYLVYVDEWNGETSLDITDDENFNCIGSFTNRYNTVDIEVDTSGIQCVNSIGNLRLLTPSEVRIASGSRIVCLLGYYSEGDKAPVYYHWSENSTDTDNGGTIIKVEMIASGRWVMDAGDAIDVRDFGAMPNETIQEDDDQNNAISSAITYCNAKGCGIKFGGTGFYDVSNLQPNRVTCSVGAYLTARTSAQSTYINCLDTSVCTDDDYDAINEEDGEMCGNIRLTGNELHNSQDYGNSGKVDFRPVSKFIFDQNNWVTPTAGISLTGMDVIVKQLTKGKVNFTSCYIQSYKKLCAEEDKELVFENCRVSESMFNSSNNLNYCTFTDCTCDQWDTFRFILKVGGSEGVVIDGQGKSIANNQELGTGIYKNLHFQGGITCDTDSNQVFENCTIEGALLGETCSLRNCTVNGNTIVTTLGVVNSNLQMVRSDTMRISDSTCTTIRVGYYIYAANVTCQYCNARYTSGDVNVDLRNFIATDNNRSDVIVNNAGNITGTAMNIIGGLGPTTIIDDQVRFSNPIVIGTEDVTRSNVRRVVRSTIIDVEDLPIISSGTGGHYRSLDGLIASGAAVGEEFLIMNGTNEAYTIRLWGTSWTYGNVEKKIVVNGDYDVIKVYYLGNQSHYLSDGSGHTTWSDPVPTFTSNQKDRET